MRIGNAATVFAIANEDLPRSTDEKTAAVHFLRFDLTRAMVAMAKAGAAITLGIDHPGLVYHLDPIAEAAHTNLVADLE